jgi:hypothetical protein
MGKNSHRRDVHNIQDEANIYFSISISHFVNENLQSFSAPREFTAHDVRGIPSSNHFYLISLTNVTSAFFQRLTKCRLCAMN